MLPRQERLRHQRDFDRLRQSGTRYHQPLLSLTVLKPEGESARMAGFIVSKRLSKKATERNLVKRRLRAAYRSLSGEVPAGCLLLFVARPEAKGVAYEQLQTQMRALLERAGLLPKTGKPKPRQGAAPQQPAPASC